jgi:hypothetical protein
MRIHGGERKWRETSQLASSLKKNLKELVFLCHKYYSYLSAATGS